MRPENWMKWDLDSRSGVKMSAFFAEHGSCGYGFFVVLTEMLYRTEGHKLPIDDDSVAGYARTCRIDPATARQYLDSIFACKLMQRDATLCWSMKVHEETAGRQRKRGELADKRRKAAEARWRKQRAKDASACKRMQPTATPCKTMPDQIRSGSSIGSSVVDVTAVIRESVLRAREPHTLTGGIPPPVPEETPEPDSVEAEAESMLMSADETPDAEWTRSPAFMSAGRRPMRKYPDIWLTRPELVHAIKVLQSKLPQTHWREVFMKVNTRLTSGKANGQRPERGNAAGWITGWALTEVLEQYNAEVKINRNRSSQWTKAS